MARGATGKRAATKPAKKTKDKRRRSPWMVALDVLLTVLSVLSGMALGLTSYAGYVSPLSHDGIWGVFPLCFPFALLATFLLFVIQLFHNRIGAVITALAMIACGGPILNYCPLHIGTEKAGEGKETFSLLTYNVLNFWPRDTTVQNNGALQYIIDQDADVVCLQEAAALVPSKTTKITKAQVDTIKARYPHISYYGSSQAILSKFPIKVIHLDAGPGNFGSGDLGAWRLTLPSGRLVTIFDVHLYSFGLNSDDKALYRQLTNLRKEPLDDVKEQLIDKLRTASKGRARQVMQLLRWIRLYGGPDAIVCGDFNDVPGCYTIHELADVGFKSAYPQVGFGPMVTFNANRFYFCIDHVLTRGDLKPLSLKKGRLKASDHYPLTVELEVL